MKFGYLRQDESSHWYLVPEEEIEEFHRITELIYLEDDHSDKWYHLINEFDDKFSQYRLSGGYQDLKILRP